MTHAYSPKTLGDRIIKRGPDECWLWSGQHRENGYAKLRALGKPRRDLRVTHIMLDLAGHPRPDGAQALHSCDNPGCVNPAHLRWGTIAENAWDRVERGRTYRASGQRSYAAKLDDETVRVMRTSSEKPTVWAKRLGLHLSTVWNAIHGRSWAHVK